MRVIHTPGHSPGHVVLLHEPTRTLFTGDAVFHRGDLALGPAALAAEPPDPRAGSLTRVGADFTAVDAFHEWLSTVVRRW